MGCVINRYAFPVRLVDHRHVVAEYTEMVRLRGGRAGLVVHEPRAPPATTVLYAHGNAETVFQLGRLLAYYASVFGVRIVAFDWPGYGATPGAPSERALCRSAEAAYQYVLRRYQLRPDEVVAWGRSIGSVAAVYLAARHPLRHLVVQSGLASAFDCVFERERCAACNALRNYRRIRAARCPATVIHGLLDATVPVRNAFKNARSLLRAGPDLPMAFAETPVPGLVCFRAGHLGLFLIRDAGHNDVDCMHQDALEHILPHCFGPRRGA